MFIILGFQIFITPPDERLMYATISILTIVCIFLPFHLRVYASSKGVHIKYTISLGRNKFIDCQEIKDAMLCDKGRGKDIYIILKDGSHTCFSPFGVDEKIVDYIKEKIYLTYTYNNPKKDTLAEEDFEALQK